MTDDRNTDLASIPPEQFTFTLLNQILWNRGIRRDGSLEIGGVTVRKSLLRLTSNSGKLLGDTAAVTAMLDRLLHHGHVLKCGPRSWRTKTQLPGDENEK